MSATQFKIDQLRKDKMIFGIEAIAVFLLAIFVVVFLPSLLFQYVYANAQLTAEPAVITYIPVVAFGGAVLFFLYAAFGNWMRMMKIKRLEREMETELLMNDDCHCGHCKDDGDMDDDFSLEDFNFEDDEDEVKKPAKKKSAKKSSTKKKSSK